MTNEKAYAPVKYGCNGVVTKFSFPFKIITKDDLIVQVQDSNGEYITLNLDIDYNVEFDDVGGEITTVKTYEANSVILISRNVSNFQSKDFTTSPGFQASEIEKGFDRVSCNLQEMDYNIEDFKKTFSAQINEEIDELENTIEENKQEVLVIQERFEDEVNAKIQEVSEAASKINALEQAVLDAQTSADNAQVSANEAQAQKVDLISQGEKLVEDIEEKSSESIEELNKIKEETKGFKDELIESGMYKFNLFDTKISDHILSGSEAKGWALQGSYVNKSNYPDFYNKCLEQKNTATETEVTLGESTLTMFVNSNGHQFYDISDKSAVDTFYETYGIADFYGVDEENERVFLPRNKYFAVTGGVVDDRLESNENKYSYYCVGNTQVTQAITNVTEVTTSENDTIPLFTGMYFDFKPNNVSWLKAGVQQNSAGIYKTCYDTLVGIVNGVNDYDLKVINQADMLSDVNYDEYWVLDQDNLTFRTPLTISNKALSGAVVGNGMTLGLTNESMPFGGLTSRSVSGSNVLCGTDVSYGTDAGTSISGTASNMSADKTVGITPDPTKSGIIAEQSTAQLYFKVANAVQNLELLDVGEVLEALGDKLDKGHKEEIISWGMPDFENAIIVTLPYTTPCDGWINANLSAGPNTWGGVNITSNGVTQGIVATANTSCSYASTFGFAPKGAVLTNSGTALTVRFMPLKGIEL